MKLLRVFSVLVAVAIQFFFFLVFLGGSIGLVAAITHYMKEVKRHASSSESVDPSFILVFGILLSSLIVVGLIGIFKSRDPSLRKLDASQELNAWSKKKPFANITTGLVVFLVSLGFMVYMSWSKAGLFVSVEATVALGYGAIQFCFGIYRWRSISKAEREEFTMPSEARIFHEEKPRLE